MLTSASLPVPPASSTLLALTPLTHTLVLVRPASQARTATFLSTLAQAAHAALTVSLHHECIANQTRQPIFVDVVAGSFDVVPSFSFLCAHVSFSILTLGSQVAAFVLPPSPTTTHLSTRTPATALLV